MMSWVSLVHLLHWVATAIFWGLIIYGWRFRSRPAAKAILIFFALSGLWTFAAALVYLIPSLEAKILINRIKMVGVAWLPLSIFSIGVFFNGKWHPHRWLWVLLGLVPLVCGLILISPNHELLVTHYRELVGGSLATHLAYGNGPLFVYYNIYSRVIILWALALLFWGARSFHHKLKMRSYKMGLGILLPFIADSVAVFYIEELRYVQITPTVLAFSGLIMAHIVFNQKGMELIPLGRSWVVENLNDAYLLFDRYANVTDYNPRSEVILPNLGDVFSSRVDDLFAADPIVAQQFHLNRNRDEATFEWERGETIYKVTQKKLYRRQNAFLGWLLVFNDITKTKRVERDLRELAHMKSKFLGIMAHDLVGHVRALSMTSQHLKDQSSSLSAEELNRTAQLIHNSSEAMNQFIQELLYWSRSQQNSISPQLERVEVASIVDAIFHFLRPLAKASHIVLKNDISNDFYINADKNMLGTVLRNLIENGIKYGPQNTTLNVKAKLINQEVQFYVLDQGPSINDDFIEKLFASKDLNHSYIRHPHGLGLELCRDFVHRLGGKIWVDSLQDHPGKAFCFTVPQ
jgi:signal transduction histidine kinase